MKARSRVIDSARIAIRSFRDFRDLSIHEHNVFRLIGGRAFGVLDVVFFPTSYPFWPNDLAKSEIIWL